MLRKFPTERKKVANAKPALEAFARSLPVTQVVERDRIPNPLRWSGVFMELWEILVYDRIEYWEACFFRWGEQHEHVSGDSFEEALRRVEQRIHLIKYEGTEH